MLAVSDYRVCYGQSEVLHGLNFTVQPNEIVAIMGRNGMGKTTLMKSLMGVIPSASGSVKLGETEVSSLKSYQRVATGFGFVPQGRMIFSSMTVKENIETGLTSTNKKMCRKNSTICSRYYMKCVAGAAAIYRVVSNNN